jgi:hypothetical protein
VESFSTQISETATLLAQAQLSGDRDGGDTLEEITESAARAVPGADYAGITLASGDGIRTLASTDPYVKALDDVQADVREGPCLTAAWENDTVRVHDLTTEQRWPAYRDAALDQTPIRSILSFRIFADKDASAALNFFADSPAAFTEQSAELGLIFATHAAIAWGMQRRDRQFRSALASRDVIGQAKGIIMERFDLDAVQAFGLLKRLSQDGNTPLHQVAERLVKSPRGSASAG